jgi:hypothetical protein
MGVALALERSGSPGGAFAFGERALLALIFRYRLNRGGKIAAGQAACADMVRRMMKMVGKMLLVVNVALFRAARVFP